MKFCLTRLAAFLLATMMASQALASDDVSAVDVSSKFVAALQNQRFKDAAAMFAPDVAPDTRAIELALKRLDDRLGGFADMRPVAYPPDGRTIKLEIPAHKSTPGDVQRSFQVRYVSTARDGEPVFYEVNLTADHRSPRVLSFGLHLPASDARSASRANRLLSAMRSGPESQGALGTPACLDEQFALSANKQSCVRRCPANTHYSPETKKCGGCGSGSMIDEQGNCHPGI